MDSLSRKMSRVCQICGDVAKSMHFGGLSCDSCKAFFRRSVQNDAFRHFRCGGDKQCNISIASRKFCKYCRFNKCEQVGMVKAWVMSEEERIQLMKSRLNKKLSDSGDDEGLRDDLYSSYKGRVALTAGGAPNLHGLNRRRHMECRMREEGEVDPSLYASASKASTTSRKKDKTRETGEVDLSDYQFTVKSSGGAAGRKSEREPGEVDPRIYGSSVQERKTSRTKSSETMDAGELDPFPSGSSEYLGAKKKERRVSKETDSSCSQDSEQPNDIGEEDEEIGKNDGGSTGKLTSSFSDARSCSPGPSSESDEDDAGASATRNDSGNFMDNRMSDSVERTIDCRTPDSNYGTNSPRGGISSRPSSDSYLEQSISNDNSPFPQVSSFTPESNSSSKSSITEQPQFSSSYSTVMSTQDFEANIQSQVFDRKDSLSITDIPHQHQRSECGPQFPSKQHISCRRLSSSLTFRPSEYRHRPFDYSNKENDALFQSLGCSENSVTSLTSSVCRETKLEDADSVLSDSNDSLALHENKEQVALRSFPIEPDKYTVMINERPEVPITNYMSRGELIKLKSIVQNMQMMEHSLPYTVTAEFSVMEHYSHFIRRVTFFLNQFEEFTSWSKFDRERSIKQNITVIALVFGSSFMKKGGTYKNTLHNPSNTVTDMVTIQGTLTPNVFDTFKEVLGILGQFEVDIRMGYMLIFNIIFDPQKHSEAHQCYGQLLFKYICWKYGAANAAGINFNLFKALEGIRKHAYVFESMSANGNQMENDDGGRIMDVSKVSIKTENQDEIIDAEDSRCDNQASNSTDKFEALRKMYYSGASIAELSKFYHGSAKPQMQTLFQSEAEPISSPRLPILSELPLQQCDSTADTQAVSGEARSPSQNFSGGPLSRGMQEMIAQYGGGVGGNRIMAGDSMNIGIQDMMNKHGASKLKEMYEKGQISDLRAMIHQNNPQQQPMDQRPSTSGAGALPHHDLSKLKEIYQEGTPSHVTDHVSAADGRNISNSENLSAIPMDMNPGHYGGKSGKFWQMMAQQHGMEVNSAVAGSSLPMSDFKMNQLLNPTPWTEIENDHNSNFSGANFGNGQQRLNDRTELSSQANRLRLNTQESSRRQSYDPHAFSPHKSDPALATATNPCGVPNIHDYRCNPLVSPLACSDQFSRLSTSSSYPNLEETMSNPHPTFPKSHPAFAPHAAPNTLPHAAHHPPIGDLFLEGSVQTRPYHPTWGPVGVPFHTDLQPPLQSGPKPFEFPFNNPNQFQPSRLPRHPTGPERRGPQQYKSKSEGLHGSEQSNSFSYFNYDGKNADPSQSSSNTYDFF